MSGNQANFLVSFRFTQEELRATRKSYADYVVANKKDGILSFSCWCRQIVLDHIKK